MTLTRSEWAVQFLAHAAWEESREKVIALVAQATKEGSLAHNNPLDTEEGAPTATDYNAAGVKNYGSLEAGFVATLKTFENGYYPQLVAILSTPQGGSSTAYATNQELNTWGTGSCLIEVESIKAGDPHGYMDATVWTHPNPAPAPPVPPPPPKPEEAMTAHDPVTGGIWATTLEGEGACFSYLGAPFIPGLNTHPDYHAAKCVAIEYWIHEASGKDGLAFLTDAPAPAPPEGTGGPYSIYKFDREGHPA